MKIEEFVRKDIKLPSPPVVAVRLLEAIRKETPSFRDFAAIIGSDPALAAKILKVANSSFYSLSQKVSSIERALAVLGLNVVKSIALSFVVAGSVRGREQGGFEYDYFWKRSVTAGVAAELVSPLFNHPKDESFLTGLLQDIGIAVLYSCKPSEYLLLMEERKITGEPIHVMERKLFGFDHQEVGSEILKSWGLSENIYVPIRFHHGGEPQPDAHRVMSRILELSDRISSLYHGGHTADRFREVREALGDRTGGDEEITALVDSVAAKTVEILDIFEIPPGGMKPFSQIIQEANEELVRQNMSYEMLLIEYKQAKEKAEQLTLGLQAANVKLREISIRDGMTGLYNHRHFEELLEQEMDRAMRYVRPLSLFMVDIDHFKKINDRYGHPAGDRVIATIGEILRKCTRKSDKAARYGGEEFVCILPETGPEGAQLLAERVRKAVEACVFSADGVTIRGTVSVGVASYNPQQGPCGPGILVQTADKALYASKNAGRNRTSHFPVPQGPRV
ncbi:MAG: sensor domain-containing diguanylate cyclase [Candidatus Deferrimicrobiaceae bacterium]